MTWRSAISHATTAQSFGGTMPNWYDALPTFENREALRDAIAHRKDGGDEEPSAVGEDTTGEPEGRPDVPTLSPHIVSALKALVKDPGLSEDAQKFQAGFQSLSAALGVVNGVWDEPAVGRLSAVFLQYLELGKENAKLPPQLAWILEQFKQWLTKNESAKVMSMMRYRKEVPGATEGEVLEARTGMMRNLSVQHLQMYAARDEIASGGLRTVMLDDDGKPIPVGLPHLQTFIF